MECIFFLDVIFLLYFWVISIIICFFFVVVLEVKFKYNVIFFLYFFRGKKNDILW